MSNIRLKSQPARARINSALFKKLVQGKKRNLSGVVPAKQEVNG